MAEAVEIELGDGTTVTAEVVAAGPAAGGGGDAGRRDVARNVALRLDEVRETVRSLGRWAAETAEGAADAGRPDTFEMEFGLKLAVKSGHLVGVIAEAGTEASLTVRMSWDLAARRTARAGEPAAGGDGA